jgi:lactoylglutathione lyase
MKIHHIALYVQDLEAMRAFFIKYFEAASNEGYHNPKTGLRSYFLSFENGAQLEIMTRPDLVEHKKEIMHTGYTHLAFTTGSKEKVDQLTEQLVNDGYIVISGPRTTGDGYYESCILGPENNQIEIIA